MAASSLGRNTVPVQRIGAMSWSVHAGPASQPGVHALRGHLIAKCHRAAGVLSLTALFLGFGV